IAVCSRCRGAGLIHFTSFLVHSTDAADGRSRKAVRMGRSSSSSARRLSGASHHVVEQLESRRLLNAQIFQGTLDVGGSEGDDVIIIHRDDATTITVE